VYENFRRNHYLNDDYADYFLCIRDWDCERQDMEKAERVGIKALLYFEVSVHPH
jgi:hypothetical protein